jgi:hypothetical protein
MSVELNWHEGDEHPNIVWDTAAQDLPVPQVASTTIVQAQPATSKLRMPRARTWALLLAIPLLLLAIAGGVLLWRANQGNEAARRDIEAVAQAALLAQRDGDRELLKVVLDPFDAPWIDQQLAKLAAQPVSNVPTAVSVARVELSGSRALAEVVETQADGNPLRKLVYFRRSDEQWRLAPAEPTLLGDQAQQESVHFTVIYRQQDEPYIGDLINAAEGAYVTLCGELRCRSGGYPLRLQLQYDLDAAVDGTDGQLHVPSPSLTGIDQAGKPTPALYSALVRQMAARLAQAKAPEAAPALWHAVGDWAAKDLAGANLPGAALFQERLEAGELPLPLDMVWSEVAIEGNADNGPAMAQMSAMLAFVQATYGSDAAGKLIEDVPDHLHAIVRRSFAVDIQAFEQAWQEWLGAFPMLAQ